MNAIEVSHLGKSYRLRKEQDRSLKSALLGFFRRPDKQDQFWALKDVSFEVIKGETLGIIGANGAGKSTLLGLIAKTIKETEGAVKVQGKISSLLELGAGFHPELTGRENIYLNGAILGLSRKEIGGRYEEIVKFSELEKFMDVPVKHYSSGMYVRLGFAVAVEVNPDILLLDEVLAVGDETFRKKCLNRIYNFKRQGKAMLIVSHDLDTVKAISDRVLLIDHGKQIQLGRPESVIDEYLWLGSGRSKAPTVPKQWGSREVQIKDIKFLSKNGTQSQSFQSLDDILVEIYYEAQKVIKCPVFGFSISDDDGKIFFGHNTQIQGMNIPQIEGQGKIVIFFPRIPLIRGKYLFSFSVHNEDHSVNYHRKENAHVIEITSHRPEVGFVELPVKWKKD